MNDLFRGNGNAVELLLVEDNPGDTRLMIEVLKESKITTHLSVARDGVEALAFLRQEGQFVKAPRPDLIILDLNLPKKDGREVLAEVKTDTVLKMIPVVVLTTSQAKQDIFQSYNLHANCYIAKSVDLQQFTTVIRFIEDFWLGVVKLPPQP